MKQKTLYIIGGSITGLILTFFAYKIYKADQDKKSAKSGKDIEVGDESGAVGANQQSSTDAKPSSDSFPLKIASYGYKVAVLQTALNSLGASLQVDGRFGQKTYDSINDFGQLPFYSWSVLCDLGGCTITESDYNDILDAAKEKDFNLEQVKELVSESWLPFTKGDNWAYNNLTM